MATHNKEVAIIVAMSTNRAIGKDNKLLWHLPNDLQFFKRTTMGCSIIMGRKTFESIGRLLPGRQNIIVTRNEDYTYEGAIICHSLDEAIAKSETDKVFVIGGGEMYKQAMDKAKELFVTRVDTTIEGDTFFPELTKNSWQLVWDEEQEVNDKNKLAHTFQKYERLT